MKGLPWRDEGRSVGGSLRIPTTDRGPAADNHDPGFCVLSKSVVNPGVFCHGPCTLRGGRGPALRWGPEVAVGHGWSASGKRRRVHEGGGVASRPRFQWRDGVAVTSDYGQDPREERRGRGEVWPSWWFRRRRMRRGCGKGRKGAWTPRPRPDRKNSTWARRRATEGTTTVEE